MFEFVTNWISRLAFGSVSSRQADDPGQTDSTTPQAGCESGVSPPAADYTRLMERLDNWSSFLSNSCQEVEHDFLQMGEHLQSIYNRATALTSGSVVPVADLRVKFGMPQTETSLDTRIVVMEITVADDTLVLGALADSVHLCCQIICGSGSSGRVHFMHQLKRCIRCTLPRCFYPKR